MVRQASGPQSATCGQRRAKSAAAHKIANVLDKLPRSLQPKAKAKLHEARNAPTRVACDKAIGEFVETYEAKYPKAAASLVDGRDKLVTHPDFSPAEHWQHLRTTNPIESTFSPR